MRLFIAKRNFLLLHDDGSIHYPFSKFLTHEFDNPHTRELVSQSLRVLAKFFEAQQIELAVRALEGRCLTYDEIKSLAGLCFRPIGEIEMYSNTKVVLITSAQARRAPEELFGALEANTAAKRLNHIASYLKFFYEVFLIPHIKSSSLREQLGITYEHSCARLNSQIAGTKQGHYLTIRSLPSKRFLEIIRMVVLEPGKLFRTKTGRISSTLYRDRAMFLLACEGLRPGAIGNISRDDFHKMSGHLVIKDNRGRRIGRPTTGTPVQKGANSTMQNYASETMIKLWPFTIKALDEYLEYERGLVLQKYLKNRSLGFLFLNSSGEPIKHRSTLTSMFQRTGEKLNEFKLLDVGNDPYFADKAKYDFYGYVLRHSAASLFLELNGLDAVTLDKMKVRFGWAMSSTQPQRYAARALSEHANMELKEFYGQLLHEARTIKN